MATGPYSLAGVTLFAAPDPTQNVGGFEVPQDLEVGLETWGSIHRIPQTGQGNAKIIAQTFGVFPVPIKWTAYFLGATAEQRAATLAAAQQAQQIVPFIAGTRRWDVVIWSFTEKIRSRFDIEYSIEIRPLVERSGRTPNGPVSTPASTNLTTQYNNLVTLAGSAP